MKNYKNTIIAFKGGLGNQMFQYAFYLSMKNQFGNLIIHKFKEYEPLKLFEYFDIDEPNHTKGLINYYLNSNSHRILKSLTFKVHFKNKPRLLNYVLDEYQIIEKKSFFRDGDIIDGYWQSLRLIDFDSLDFRDIFNLKRIRPIYFELINSILSNIDNPNSLAIHVRRGDYLENKILGGICSFDYYLTAIEKFPNCKNYFFFTDDLKWVKENFNFSNAKFYCHNNEIIDLMLMSQFQNLIISNSSFSWWASYIGYPEKKVIAPSKWFQNEKYNFNAYVSEWELIDS